MKKLAVNVDDVGIHPAVNDAARRLAEAGRVDSVSVISCGRAVREAFPLLRSLQGGVRTGCHLTLVEEKPLLAPNRIPSLVEASGRLPLNYRRLLTRVSLGRVRREEIKNELAAQIEAMLENGLKVTRLDSHQHVHIHPVILEIVIDLAKRYGIPAVRVPFDPWAVLGRYAGTRAIAAGILNLLSRQAWRRLERAGLEPYRSFGVVRSGQMTAAIINDYMKTLNGEDFDCELIMHPNSDNPRFNAAYPRWKFNGEGEFSALTDTGFSDVLARGGFERSLRHAHAH